MPNTEIIKRRYQIADFISDWMIIAADYLWINRKRLNNDGGVFDYPDYGDLPRRCAMKLSSGTVDWIQETAPFQGMSKKEFQKKFIGLCLFEY